MKTILVTGTNKGIGLEFARQYLNEGFKVIATCRNLSKLDGLNGLVNSFPDKISIYQMELLDEKSIEDFSLEIYKQRIGYQFSKLIVLHHYY